MKPRLTRLLASLLLLVALAVPVTINTGCAGPERTVLNTVIASRMTVGEALEIFKAQVRAGKVDKATFDKAKLALETYKKASTSALKALKTYEATGDQDAWLKASTISAQASSDLINILAPFVPGLR